MKKEGFTLVELLVSLVLVTVVLSSMSMALVKLKDTYSKANNKTDIELTSSSIVSIINKDIIDNGGISSWKLDDDLTLSLELVNGSKRTLSIDNIDNLKIKCISNDNNSINEYTGAKRYDKSTLKYVDSTNNQIVYIKSMDYICHYNNKITSSCPTTIKDEECTNTSGNKFLGFTIDEGNKEYNLKNKTDKVKLMNIIIKLNDSKNDIYLTSLETIK